MCETGRAEVSEEESDEETQQEAELEAEPCQRKRKGRGVSRVVSEMENLAVTQVCNIYLHFLTATLLGLRMFIE